MAAAGYPLLGDGKYGKLDKQYDRKIQALYSYKLTFCFNKFRQNFSRFLLTKEGVPYMMSIGTSAFLWMY